LSLEECAWVDGYHQRVLDRLAPLVDDETLAWLKRATAPLNSDGL